VTCEILEVPSKQEDKQVNYRLKWILWWWRKQTVYILLLVLFKTSRTGMLPPALFLYDVLITARHYVMMYTNWIHGYSTFFEATRCHGKIVFYK